MWPCCVAGLQACFTNDDIQPVTASPSSRSNGHSNGIAVPPRTRMPGVQPSPGSGAAATSSSSLCSDASELAVLRQEAAQQAHSPPVSAVAAPPPHAAASGAFRAGPQAADIASQGRLMSPFQTVQGMVGEEELLSQQLPAKRTYSALER